MDNYLWAIYALISALSMALMFLASEYYKQSGVGFLMIARSLTATVLLPFVFFVDWPTEPLFYLYGAIPFILFPIADILLFRISAQYGAGIITRFMPLTAILIFFIWLVIDRDTWQSYINNPFIAIAIILCLGAIIFCASFLRSCQVSRTAFKIFLPALFLASIATLAGKLAMDATEATSASLVNLFVGSFIGIAVYGVLYKIIPSVKAGFSMTQATVKAGIISGIFSTLLIYFANLSYDLVSNPAYTTAVSFSSAIWMLILYKLIGRQDNARILPGLGIVFFAAILVLLSAMI